ncbi:hypothetical protein CGI76_17925, partial [Vibrio parahaemolyticus]|uniref:hypothetical protein n=1 Tax=Vibrio parahaemolyticus TaxID=670 RepID=UPI0011688C13
SRSTLGGLVSRLNYATKPSEYFSPRTATKKRLLDVFRLRLALIKPEGLDEEIIRAAAFK